MPIETGLGGGLVSVTSTNVGPLTSTFTPASSCSNLHLHYIRPSNSVDQASQVWLYGNQCLGLTKTVPSNCLPSDYVSIYNSLGDAHDRTYPVMSPGYGCPVGYEPSCTMMQIPPATTGLTRAWRVLAQNETAIGCCPRGYECPENGMTGNFYPYCTSAIPPGATVTGTVNDVCATAAAANKISSLSVEYSVSAWAQAAQLVYIQGPSTTSSIAPKSTDTSSQQGNVEPTQQAVVAGQGLSTAAKVAIAVSVSVGAILLGIAVFIWYNRKKKKQKEMEMEMEMEKKHDEPRQQDAASETDTGDFQIYDKPELDAGIAIIPSELDGMPMTPASELEGTQARWTSHEYATELVPIGSRKPESFVELSGDSIHLLPVETSRTSTSITRKPVARS